LPEGDDGADEEPIEPKVEERAFARDVVFGIKDGTLSGDMLKSVGDAIANRIKEESANVRVGTQITKTRTARAVLHPPEHLCRRGDR
jgi:hypothetical protein